MSIAASASTACFDIIPAPLEYFGHTSSEFPVGTPISRHLSRSKFDQAETPSPAQIRGRLDGDQAGEAWQIPESLPDHFQREPKSKAFLDLVR
jgi:hypothetical protein